MKNPTPDDPIVAEVHEIRRRILDEGGGDIERLIERLRSAETQDKNRIVTKDDFEKRTAHDKDRPMTSG